MKAYSHPALADVPLSAVMQALSDPCRIAIVRALMAAEELACNEVPLKISKATRSHHFAVWREAGIAFTRTDGTKCMTSVRRKEFDRRFPGLLDLVLQTDSTRGKRPAEVSRSGR